MAVPELWRTTRQRYSLRAEICPHCEEAVFPPRAVCPHCHREVRMSVQLNQSAPAMPPVREFIYGLPASINSAIHAAMQNSSAHMVAAGDD
jgi:hypothetical protein